MLLDRPPNRAFAGVVGAIQDGFALGILPGAIEGQAWPQVPTVQEQVA